MQLILKIPSSGYKNLSIIYDCQRSSASKGATTNNYSYSVDNGANWITSGLSVSSNPTSDTWSLLSVSINDSQADNNGNLLFKVTFSGGVVTGTSGNDRFDNITVEGTSIGGTTAIEQNQFNNTDINMSPNTTKNGVVNFSEVVDAVVYNVQGKQVKAVAKTNQLVTSDLNKGLYVVRINGSVSKKLIIE
ncbi:MAG: T9SS type A sorting domain-containing protein [Paludibacter sp.]